MPNKLIPAFLKIAFNKYLQKKYFLKWQQDLIDSRMEQEKRIPKLELEQKHINNLKVVLNRKLFLQYMPYNAVCAEIGVHKGDFSDLILKITNPKKLHLIDAWGDEQRYHDGLKESVSNFFLPQITNEQVEINVGLSTDVLCTFPDNYFDWVYIDTAHTYDITSAELSILKTKMKKDGIIAGHDYIIGNWQAWFRYGVIEAVHEFCILNNWELIYLTIESNHSQSFAIKKIL